MKIEHQKKYDCQGLMPLTNTSICTIYVLMFASHCCLSLNPLYEVFFQLIAYQKPADLRDRVEDA